MKVDRSQTIDGIPLIKVRDMLRRMGGHYWSKEHIAEHLGRDVNDALVAAGMITVIGPPVHTFWLVGKRIQHAWSATKPDSDFLRLSDASMMWRFHFACINRA
jgi:hypothetical protein